jgi:hypothetical protein
MVFHGASKVGLQRGLRGSARRVWLAVVAFSACAPLGYLANGILGEQLTAITNIDSVFLSDALGVVNPWGSW